jgi:hypothetical protein
MLKKLLLTAVLLLALLAYASPAMAMSGAYGASRVSATLYVDTAYTGTESGTPAQPYKTVDAAVAQAQALPYGANIWMKDQATGYYSIYYGYIAGVYGGPTGTPLSTPVMFGLLALLCLGMIVGGWFLLRRSHARALPA